MWLLIIRNCFRIAIIATAAAVCCLDQVSLELLAVLLLAAVERFIPPYLIVAPYLCTIITRSRQYSSWVIRFLSCAIGRLWKADVTSSS